MVTAQEGSGDILIAWPRRGKSAPGQTCRIVRYPVSRPQWL